MRLARAMKIKRFKFKTKYYGYSFVSNRFIFNCICGYLLKRDHSDCKKHYKLETFKKNNAQLSTTMSSINSIISNKLYTCMFDYDDPSESFELSNIVYTLFLYYGYVYSDKNIVLNNIYKYKKMIKCFKYFMNKKLLVLQLCLDNVSVENIDRNNIIFRNISTILNNKLVIGNPYYFSNIDKSLQEKIKSHYLVKNKYENYELHDYEKKNRISPPILQSNINPISSYPTNYPLPEECKKLHLFVKETSQYISSIPVPPVDYRPVDIKYSITLQDYFSEVGKDYGCPPSVVSYDVVVTQKMKSFPNKKYIDYDKYKDIECYYCHKKGHVIKICEEIVDINSINDSLRRDLARFVLDYPKNKIEQRVGKYSDIIFTLPKVYEYIVKSRNKFWFDFGKGNPFSNKSKFWSFGDRRRHDIGYLWAIGASKVYLLKLIAGYESKLCRSLPRYQFKNHKTWYTFRKQAYPVIDEYLHYGILREVSENSSLLILPMSIVLKSNGKPRIVVDGRPLNIYVPSMKFTPNKIGMVRETIFPRARVLTQDGRHAFFQLPVTPLQALRQCIKFYWPPAKRTIVCAFTTEIFGSNVSCYRFVKMENQINNFFRLVGIQMNSFYDDSLFYAQDCELSAAVLGSFIKRIYYHCGRQLNEDKTDLLKGSYQFKFCGFDWHSLKMVFTPLPKLKNTTKSAISDMVTSCGHRVPIKSLVSIMGKFGYIGHAITYMSILLSPFKDTMRLFHSRYGQDDIWYKKFVVSESMVESLNYIYKIVEKKWVVPIVISKWDIEIVTDASNRMVGSYDSLSNVVVVPLPPEYVIASSTLREAYGLFVAINNRLPNIRGKRVRVLIDNLGTSTILMRNGSKVKELNKIVYKIIQLCVENDIFLWVRWMRRETEAIKFADDLSKSIEADRWIFDNDIFQYIRNKLRLPEVTIDLLADKDNAIVSRYFSRFKDNNAIDYNWMRQNYSFFGDQISYLNPPFRGDYLYLSIQQIINKEITSYVILPVWPSARWYNKVMQYSNVIIFIKNGSDLFQSPQYMTLRDSKKWKILIVFFKFPVERDKPLVYTFNPELMTLSTRSVIGSL